MTRALSICVALFFTLIMMLCSYYYLAYLKFGYMGFENSISADKLLFSILMCLFVSIYISFIKEDFNQLIVSLLYIFVLAPNATLFSFMDGNEIAFFWGAASIFISNFVLTYFPVFRIPTLGVKNRKYLLWVLMILCLIPVYLAHGIKLNFQVFLLEDVYDIRRESRESNNFLSVYGYFWLAKVICPIAIIYALKTKNAILAGASLLVLCYLFMTTGHKSVYFTIFIIFALYFGENTYRDKVSKIVFFTLFVFIFARLLSISFDFILMESLFVRRLFLIPALLNIYYAEFFSEPIYYATSFLSGLIEYPYTLMPPQLIGQYYYDSPEMSANAGYIADGYANLSHFGVLINIIISAWFMKFFKGYNIEAKYSGLIFVIFYAFQGSALTTVFFTHGALLLLVLLPLVLKVSNDKNHE
ncbi:hypothetical protein ACET92_01185 [Aeromonas veronii]